MITSRRRDLVRVSGTQWDECLCCENIKRTSSVTDRCQHQRLCNVEEMNKVSMNIFHFRPISLGLGISTAMIALYPQWIIEENSKSFLLNRTRTKPIWRLMGMMGKIRFNLKFNFVYTYIKYIVMIYCVSLSTNNAIINVF